MTFYYSPKLSLERNNTIQQMNKYANALHTFIDTVPEHKRGPLVTEWKNVVDWINAQFRYGKFN